MDNKINGRTPEEIKKGLECCTTRYQCSVCPYNESDTGWGCVVKRNKDVLQLIQQLEHERDAAVKDLHHAASGGESFCDICKYKGEPCDERQFNEIECWEWRGPQEVGP